jgi:hypothetical protein
MLEIISYPLVHFFLRRRKPLYPGPIGVCVSVMAIP